MLPQDIITKLFNDYILIRDHITDNNIFLPPTINYTKNSFRDAINLSLTNKTWNKNWILSKISLAKKYIIWCINVGKTKVHPVPKHIGIFSQSSKEKIRVINRVNELFDLLKQKARFHDCYLHCMDNYPTVSIFYTNKSNPINAIRLFIQIYFARYKDKIHYVSFSNFHPYWTIGTDTISIDTVFQFVNYALNDNLDKDFPLFKVSEWDY